MRGLHQTTLMLGQAETETPESGPASGREGVITIATTAKALQDTIAVGAEHIEVREHLNLASLTTPAGSTDPLFKLSDMPQSVKTIRGNCSAAAGDPLTTLSIASTPPMHARTPNQCVLLANWPVFQAAGTQLWIDNFYIRFQRTDSDPTTLQLPDAMVSGRKSKMWITSSTVQGDGTEELYCLRCGVNFEDNTFAFVKDCIFSDWSGPRTLWVSQKSTLNILSSNISDNNIGLRADAATIFVDSVGGVVSGSDGNVLQIEDVDFSGNVPTNRPLLVTNQRMSHDEVKIIGESDVQVCNFDVDLGACEYSAVQPLEGANVEFFVTAENEWLLAAQQEVELFTKGQAYAQFDDVSSPAAAPPQGSSDVILAEDNNTAAAVPSAPAQRDVGSGQAPQSTKQVPMLPIVLGTIAAALVVLLLAGAALATSRRRRNHIQRNSTTLTPPHLHRPEPASNPTVPGAAEPHQQHPPGSTNINSTSIHRDSLHAVDSTATTEATHGQAGYQYEPGNCELAVANAEHSKAPQALMHSAMYAADVPMQYVKGLQTENAKLKIPNSNSNSNLDARYSQLVVGDCDKKGRTKRTAGPVNSAVSLHRKALLEEQLDSMVGQHLVGDLLVLPGFENRFAGGQAIVQIVAEEATRTEYAMKFFLSEAAFILEKTLYNDESKPMGKFLPQLHSIHEEGKLKDVEGNALPRCIVMEKGVALDMWVADAGGRLDNVGCLQALSHVTARLQDMHSAGYVHRDLKPCNIMWLPRKKRFTLIDFGCAAPTANPAPVDFTLRYAAPEVLKAAVAGEDSIVAAEATDAWAVGMLALELFGGRPVFDVMDATEQIIAMVLGDQQAPWEHPDTAPDLLSRLGRLRQMVLGMLQRDPLQRTTVAQFSVACQRIMSTTTCTPT